MLLRPIRLEKTIALTSEISTEILKASLVTFLAFTLLDNIVPGYVSDYFNINILLWILVTSGFIAVLLRGDQNVEPETETYRVNAKKWMVVSVGVGILSAGLVFYQSRSIGLLAYLLTVTVGLAVAILCMYLGNNSEPDQ